MRVTKDMVLREIAGEYVLIPTGEAAKKLYGIISLTESGKLLWETLAQDCTEEELVETILKTYEVDRQTASADVKRFIEKLTRENLLL